MKLLITTVISVFTILFYQSSYAATFVCENTDPFGVGSIDQSFKAKWRSNPTFRLSTDSDGFGFPPSLDAGATRLNRIWVEQAAREWSDVSGSSLSIRVIDDNNSQLYNNGQNEISIAAGSYNGRSSSGTFLIPIRSNNPAFAVMVYDRGESTSNLGNNRFASGLCNNQDINILEADIVVNRDFLDPENGIDLFLASSPLEFRRTMLHEFGHAIGLGHENRALSQMMPLIPNAGGIGPLDIPSLVTDDLNGLIALYGNSSPRTRDIAASAWGCCRTVFVNGSPLNSAKNLRLLADDGRSPNGSNISPGKSVFVPITVYNRGGRREDVSVDIFLVNLQTSVETTLKRVEFGFLPRGAHIEHKQHLNIPLVTSSFSFGQYRLGWRVDPDNRIPESGFELVNNVAFMDEIFTYSP